MAYSLRRLSLERPEYWNTACSELAARDPVLKRVIEENTDDHLRNAGDAFRTLLNAVVGQQISVAAAESIWKSLTALMPRHDPAPEDLLSFSPEDLRAIGLSNRKVEYVQGIARAFMDASVKPERWPEMSDAQVAAELTALRGIGPWTADMMLIFHLRRPDVLPLGDIGLVNGATRLYGWDESIKLPERVALLRDHAERWRPWRSVATWYVWRDLDTEPVVY